MDHGAAPHDRGTALDEEAYGQHLDTVVDGRDNRATGLHVGRYLRLAHHLRDGRAENIRVQYAHPRATEVQRRREVGGHRGLTHAALARGHRDDITNGRQAVGRGTKLARDLGGEIHGHPLDPGDLPHGLDDTGPQSGLRRTQWRGETHGHHRLRALHGHGANHIGGNQIPA